MLIVELARSALPIEPFGIVTSVLFDPELSVAWSAPLKLAMRL